MAGCREASRDMHHRLEQLHLIEHGLLAAQLIQIAIEPGLTLANQPCQADGGAHIGERIVRLQMLQTIGHAEPLQLERDATILLRPHQPFGAQRIGRAHQIDQVPAAVAALPFARIGIMEVAVQAVARYLIIEAQGVVAGAASARQRQLLMQQMDELGFAQPLAGERLGCDPGHQASGRMRQDVVTETAVDVQGLANLFQRLVGADAGDLQRPIAARGDASGFEVIPEDAGRHGRFLLDHCRLVYPATRQPCGAMAVACGANAQNATQFMASARVR